MAQGGNTYQLEPKEDQRFYSTRVKSVIESVFNERLKGATYDASKSGDVAEELGRVIRSRVKQLKIPRYKLAVQVFLGEMKGQGLRIGSKCLWDPNFDNSASYTFTNQSLHCTGIVFGVYTQ